MHMFHRTYKKCNGEYSYEGFANRITFCPHCHTMISWSVNMAMDQLSLAEFTKVIRLLPKSPMTGRTDANIV